MTQFIKNILHGREIFFELIILMQPESNKIIK